MKTFHVYCIFQISKFLVTLCLSKCNAFFRLRYAVDVAQKSVNDAFKIFSLGKRPYHQLFSDVCQVIFLTVLNVTGSASQVRIFDFRLGFSFKPFSQQSAYHQLYKSIFVVSLYFILVFYTCSIFVF